MKIIINAYKECSIEFILRLNSMFAFGIPFKNMLGAKGNPLVVDILTIYYHNKLLLKNIIEWL